MSYENVILRLEDGIARLTLNRPDKLNSFTIAMHDEIRDALKRVREGIEADDGVRVLLLTGAGRGFCAGQDLGDSAMAPVGGDLGEAVERHYAPLVLSLRTLPVPVVCAVNGVAAGAGANLALACDLVLAKRTASFLQPFCKLGLLPDTGGTYFLPRLIGTARAMGLAMLGDTLTAQQACDWGLIWRCVDDEAFSDETEALLAHLASAPTLALARTKWAIYFGAEATLEQQLHHEREAVRELGFSEDFREGIAAFLSKRSPVFRGR